MKTIKNKIFILLFCTVCLTTQVSAGTTKAVNTIENIDSKGPIPEDLLGGIIHFFIDLFDNNN